MTRTRKILFSIILVIVLVPAVVAIAIQFPSVQTAVVSKAASSLTKGTGLDIAFDKVYYSIPNSLIIKGIAVSDETGDTMAYVDKVLLNVSIPSIFSDHLMAHRVSVENAEADITRILSAMPSKTSGQKDSTFKSPFISYSLDRLQLKNVAVKLGGKSCEERKKEYAVDWANLDLRDVNLDARNIHYEDSLSLDMHNLSLSEACGLNINEFSGGITMGETGIFISGFRYSDDDSHLASPMFGLLFDDFSDFSDFCNRVSFDVDFLDSHLDFKSLRHYAGLNNIDLIFNFSGYVRGPVSNLRSDDFHVASSTGNTSLDLKFRLNGLPKAAETMAGMKVRNCVTNTADIAQIVYEATGGKFNKSVISKMAPGETFTFNGSLDGLFTDFVAYGNLDSSDMGGIDMDIVCRSERGVGYLLDGFVESNDFDLGGFLATDAVGRLSCDASLSAMMGRNGVYRLDSLNVAEIGLLGGTYGDISATGAFEGGIINANIACHDPKIHFDVMASLNASVKDVSDASMRINSLCVNKDGHHYEIGDVVVNGNSSSEGSTAALTSSVTRVNFESDAPLEKILSMISSKDFSGTNSYASLRIIDFSTVSKLLAPDLFIAGGSSVELELHPDGEGGGIVRSELLAYGDNYLKGLNLDLALKGEDLNVTIDADTLQSGEIIAGNPRLDIDIVPDERYKVFASLSDSGFDLGDTRWNLSADSFGFIDKYVSVDNFVLGTGNHTITVDGSLSDSVQDTMEVKVTDFEVSLLSPLFADSFHLSGSLEGEGSVYGLMGQEKGILLDLFAGNVILNDSPFGDFQLNSDWDDADDRFNLSAENILDDGRPLAVSGYFRPEDKTIDVKASFDRMNPAIAEPFLSSVVSDVDGALNGMIRVYGPLNKLAIESANCSLDDLKCTLLYTQVPYVVNGPFSVNDKGVKLDRLTIVDSYGHKGRVSGGVEFDHLKDIRLNTKISVDNLLGLNTTASSKEAFYGKAFATGTVHLGGSPSSGILLDIDVTTEPNSTIHIPLSSTGKTQTSLLTFVGNEVKMPSSSFDSLKTFRAVEKSFQPKASPIDVRLKIDATPDAEVQLEVNKFTGDVLKTRGSGLVSIQAGGVDNVFDIRGDYMVDEGSYKLSMIGIASRDFSINPGGTISFTGDIMQSDLNMTATYSTKASIGTLIADTTSVSSRRTVDCGIGITGKLSNPEVSFSIDIPDLDPATKGKVESALNSEDKRMKQLLAVLVSGSFVPDEQSGIVNNTTVLYSNVSEIMANQLNNIFRQLEIPLDLGFNYQPTGSGKDVFDVAISTQLFNNRVSINGNLGNRQYMSSNQSDIVGDLDVEIKLNRNGRFRFNMFSHSADQYSNYLDQMQRNGAGLVFQEEFDTIGELWRKIFKKNTVKENENDSNQ